MSPDGESTPTEAIDLRGAREHNLRAVDVLIPHRALTVITGVSGSGKSSLAFDTLYREGQRRYLSALSSHARRFLGRQHRPPFDQLHNLPPALAVDQRTTVRNPRSTVGTLTGIHDYLRLLYARLGRRPEGIGTLGTHAFSFQSAEGSCPTCGGLAVVDRVDPALLVLDPTLTLRQGALVPTTKSGYIVYSQVTVDVLDQVCRAHGFDVDTPWETLTPDQQKVIFFGSDRLEVPFGKHTLESRMRWSGITARPRDVGHYKGILPAITATLARDRNPNVLRFVRSEPCDACGGTRLSEAARAVTMYGDSLASLIPQPLAALPEVLARWRRASPADPVATPILAGIESRLELLLELGLGHLELGRSSPSLSGGEAQRIRLASQVGSGLQGILYVLDEPSIGLHATETASLIRVLRRLRDQGNTLVCVEHDGATIAAADHLIDLGPGAGEAGGRVLFQGAATASGRSPTLDWLRAAPAKAGSGSCRPRQEDLTIRGATAHNLKDIDATFRLGTLNVVTGVSGAGKSTLVDLVLARALRRSLHRATAAPGHHRGIDGAATITKLVHVDQSAIGRTPRSNPATYTGMFDRIRTIFAAEPEAVRRGLGKGHFSFNVRGGRCETCQGAGQLVVGMHGLADVEVPCPDCCGARFDPNTLAVTFRGHHVAAILGLSVDAAREVFAEEAPVRRVLDTLHRLGLGYIGLGQSATTFSGGEAQRIKLATELARPASRGRTLYILDEPTTGLHARDVALLLAALDDLVDRGDTVVVIEHDLELIQRADRVIDLGPGAGEQGGQVVFQGTPDELAKSASSATGQALATFLREGFRLTATTASTPMQAGEELIVRGARTNNLRGVDVTIPHRGMTVITGVSGSGKTSLAFDTIFAEGRRRFAENLSTQARRHLPHQSSARFDLIEGLTPCLALRQDPGRPGRRSTVGTLSEVLDSYRLLFSRAGTPRATRTARMFSFNQPEGACPRCGGSGVEARCDPAKLISDPQCSLFDGAMDGHKTGRYYGERDGQHLALLAAVERDLGLDLHRPWAELDRETRHLAMFGTGDREFDVDWHFERKGRSGVHKFQKVFLGFARYVDEEFRRKHLDRRGDAIRPLLEDRPCPDCEGERLSSAVRSVTFCELTLPALCRLSIDASISFFAETVPDRADPTTAAIAAQPRAEILRRLRRLAALGLGYLNLDRSAVSLSGGESQRVRLAAQIDSRLTGVTYVLDEPTVGLHPADTEQLLAHLGELSLANTVIVVEHDPQVWAKADHVVSLGPGGGTAGGQLLAAGSPKTLPPPRPALLAPRPLPTAAFLTVRGAHRHNLDHCDVTFATRCLVAVTGVSGSGKSTLVLDVLGGSIAAGQPQGCAALDGPGFAEVHRVEDGALGTSPAVTPATYLGVFDRIRRRFAATEAARAAGLKLAAFSLVAKPKDGAGRCDACDGHGAIRTGMDFLADVWHPCEACGGRRFGTRTLTCTVDGRTIAEVLDMTIREGLEFFAEDPGIVRSLAPVAAVGLGYLRLGQPAPTLSGGEAQRLRLAAAIGVQDAGNSLYVLDEPTRGLHATDVEGLLVALRALTDRGHTVVVVEHNLDLVRSADWVVDLGPGAGEAGGRVLFSGPPADLAACSTSITGRFLRDSEC